MKTLLRRYTIHMKIAIVGYGAEGKASYSYWRDLGHEVTIVDEKEISPYDLPYGSDMLLGKNAFKYLAGYDLVVRSPGINPSKLKTDSKIWSATNEFFAKCPAPIIGVTGTKGKGTTASLIAAILTAAGKTVHLVGNIGTPALSVLPKIQPDDLAVFELSSFQLWDLEKSPHIAVALMIEADHLDVHKDMKDYVGAKSNIRRYQTDNDICIYHPTNELSAQVAAASTEGEAKRYAVVDDGAVYVKENTFFVQNQALCSNDAVQLPGAHNLENACAAITAALPFLDNAYDAIEKGLRSFTGLPHRLKLVGEKSGVRYYDDSIATTPGSAIAAISAFDEPKLLILGGSDKGADYTELIEACKSTDTHVLVIGALAGKLRKLCQKHHVAVTDLAGKTMQSIVRSATELAAPGSVVILSPAAASFDMFKNYADRGDQFVEAVKGLV